MLFAAISTVALALAVGPQLQLSLQAAIEESQPTIEVTEAESVELPVLDVDTERSAAPETTAPAAPSDASVLVDETGPADVELEAEPMTELETATETQPAPVASGVVDEADWPAILDATSSALSAAGTASGQFMQTNADGSITTGTFALQRPGRMRFDYDDPTPILIVSDGTTVAMQDSELETVDRVPIGATPLGLILSTDLNVDEDIEVLSVMQNADRVGVRVADASGELEGTLTMVFDGATYDLLGWLTTDENLQTTVVDLLEIETNVRVDPRLFRLEDADDEEDER